ncbi:hypothetical protein Q5692_10730 [Microcoleus sp. C2C3]|uniref:hypothetical protein n=1 Tax=unclassified Microcoleus TaxID=2642155 RepID=UPI002FCEF4C1
MIEAKNDIAEGRRKKEEGRRKKEEGRRKKEEAIKSIVSAINNVLTVLAVAIPLFNNSVIYSLKKLVLPSVQQQWEE